MDDFISSDAEVHADHLIAETYALAFIDEAIETPPVAFVSILNDSIKLTKNNLRRSIPNRLRRYESYPAVKIGRLGVTKNFQGAGIGTLVTNLVKEIFITNNRTGCRFITVDAYDNRATIGFYEQNGFKIYPDEEKGRETKLMFFDLFRTKKTLAKGDQKPLLI